MKKVKLILFGAGMRGIYAYGPYTVRHPDDAEFVAVAEPDAERRNKFGDMQGIKAENRFSDWKELLEKKPEADAVLICTQDRMHFEPAMAVLEAGYHILLEKPMAPDPAECIMMGDQAKKYDRIFSVCHVLRYTKFFSRLKQLIEDGSIGKLVSIQHNENVGYRHMAHSFVRGNWRNTAESSPMILSKSCHDLDILLWLAGADCVVLSSFGSLEHFRSENAPEGAPAMCLDGCPAEKDCPYYAPAQYAGITGWPATAVSLDTSESAILEALRTGSYGRCVYRCDNDVVDHQVVNMEFANGVTCVFTMSAFTEKTGRTIKLMGTRGEIRATMDDNEIEIYDFITRQKKELKLEYDQSGHGGGDENIMKDFIELVRAGKGGKGLTSADISVQSHLMAFAAEKSRLEKKVVNLAEYRSEIIKNI